MVTLIFPLFSCFLRTKAGRVFALGGDFVRGFSLFFVYPGVLGKGKLVEVGFSGEWWVLGVADGSGYFCLFWCPCWV